MLGNHWKIPTEPACVSKLQKNQAETSTFHRFRDHKKATYTGTMVTLVNSSYRNNIKKRHHVTSWLPKHILDMCFRMSESGVLSIVTSLLLGLLVREIYLFFSLVLVI